MKIILLFLAIASAGVLGFWGFGVLGLKFHRVDPKVNSNRARGEELIYSLEDE